MTSVGPRNEWRIHIGAHKTATTHVQDTLEAVRRDLGAFGIEYVPRQEIRNHGGFGRLKWWHSFVPDTQKKHWTYAYEQSKDVLLFSEERLLGRVSGLFRSPLYPDLENNMRMIQRLGSNRKITLYMTIRSFESILPSAYAQQIRMGKAGRIIFDEIKENTFRNPPLWSQVIGRILDIFDESQLKIWRYEDYKDHQDVFLSHLCNGTILTFPNIPPPESTKSPCAETIRELERICPEIRKDKRAAEASRICSLAHGGGDRFQPFSAHEVEWLQESYMKDVHFMEEKYPGLLIRPNSTTKFCK
jgi:hypothetical protein